MSVHIAVVGTGRVGRPTAYTLMCANLASEITVCDTKPGLAKAFAEELRHAAASIRLDSEIIDCERDEDVSGADIIVISAGTPRAPGVQMSRRDLAAKNAEIVRYVAEATVTRNRGAKYVVVTNPVDAMAMICKKYTRAEFTISTGTNLESLRLRSKLAKVLKVPVSKIQGWAAGEHGEAAIILWSTSKAYGMPVEEYAKKEKVAFTKSDVESYMKGISKFVIDNVGGTEYGPAASFRDILRAIINNTDEVLSVAVPMMFEGISEPVHVGVPTRLGWNVGPTLFDFLLPEEKKGIEDAAKAIYGTYQMALSAIT